MMYRNAGGGRDEMRNRGQIGRSPPRRRRTPEGENKFCIFCKIQVSSTRLYEEHKNSAVHKQKEILIGKAMSDGLQYCYTCEKIFPSKLALDAHCLMTRHKPLYRVEELQEMNNQPNNVIPPPAPPESRRAREEKERQDIVLKLNEMRGSDDNNRSPHFCDTCNVDCMTYANLKIHTESWRHRSEVDKKKDESMKKIEERKKFEEEAEKTFEADDEIERKKLPENITGKAGFFCEVCSIAAPSESAYLEHLRNRKHFRQVGQMRRPYKCYFCEEDFNVAKDFNYHLESKAHMEKAFNKDKLKKRDKDDEWVEKKVDKRDRSKDNSRDSRESRDTRKDDRSRRSWHGEKKDHRDSRLKDGKKDAHKTESKESASRQVDGRKVEIIDSPGADTGTSGIKDLREKLKGQKIIITKSNSPERDLDEGKNTNEENQQEVVGCKVVDGNQVEGEKEFDEKFKALLKEYGNDNNAGLQERLSKDREDDISAYQKYEADYKELSEEEEFIRGNLDNIEEGDPCKEDFIHDIIEVQRKMSDIRKQLELREMMIIKRESLYREAFPENEEEDTGKNTDYKQNYDYNHGDAEEINDVVNITENDITPETPPVTESNTTDLRIKLERERLMKRLGPELESVDASLREKLLAVIFEKDKDVDKSGAEHKTGDTRQVVKEDDSRNKVIRQSQMEILTKREKQLEVELAKLKSNAGSKTGSKSDAKTTSDAKTKSSLKPSTKPTVKSSPKDVKKKGPKSLVPQYDDVDDKKKDPKKRRKRSVSYSSESSHSSSSSSSGDSYDDRKGRRKRRSSKAKRSGSIEKNRRKRRRSISRDRDKRKRVSTKRGRDDEKKKRIEKGKPEKKKPVKIAVKSTEKESKVVDIDNPLPADENDSDVQEIPAEQVKSISVIGSSSVTPPTMQQPQLDTPSELASIPPAPPQQRREQFSFWKNAVAQAPTAKESPKEDIWDSAISAGHHDDTAGTATLNLFDPSSAATQLPEDILNILKSVAPIIHQTQQQSSVKDFNSKMPSASGTSSSPYSMGTPASSSFSNTSSVRLPRLQEPLDNQKPVRNSDGNDSTIRSILKKVNNRAALSEDLHEHLSNNELPPVIPGLGPSHVASSSSHLPDYSSSLTGAPRSILKMRNDSPAFNPNSSYHPADQSSKDNQEPDSPTKPYGSDNHYSRDGDRNDASRDEELNRSRLPQSGASNEESRQSKDLGGSGRLTPPNEYRRRPVPPGLDQHESYRNVDKYRNEELPLDRDRTDRLSPPRQENGPTTGRLPVENRGPYFDPARMHGHERDPYFRSEITHRVIDYSYVRDTRVIPGDRSVPPPPNRYDNDNELRQPVRYPGETDDEYYARFERFYEEKRKEQHGDNKEMDMPPRRMDAGRPEQRAPSSRDEIYRRSDFPPPNERKPAERYDDRLPRAPEIRGRLPPENFPRPRDLERHPPPPPLPLGERRVIDESVRRVENIPYKDDARDRSPYKVVEITKRTDNITDIPLYRRPDFDSRNMRNDIRPPMREFDLRNPPRLPPPATVGGEYDPKFKEY